MLTLIKKCQDGLQTLVGIRDDRDGKEGVGGVRTISRTFTLMLQTGTR